MKTHLCLPAHDVHQDGPRNVEFGIVLRVFLIVYSNVVAVKVSVTRGGHAEKQFELELADFGSRGDI